MRGTYVLMAVCVFKLVALEFPAQVGAVTGVVGATAACRLLPLPS